MSARIGVLALQGAFQAHADCIRAVGHDAREVRTPADLAGVDALVMPGGESSTMSQLLESSMLFDDIATRLESGFPVFGTCAGMILLANEIVDGRNDQRCFSALDITVRRNAYGRQVDSFEADIDSLIPGQEGVFHGVFIRAPKIERTGEAVQVLGRWNDEPVLVRQNSVLAASFHPELSGDVRLHAYFISSVCQGKE